MSPWYSFTATDTVNSTAQLSIYLRAEDQHLAVLPGRRPQFRTVRRNGHRPTDFWGPGVREYGTDRPTFSASESTACFFGFSTDRAGQRSGRPGRAVPVVTLHK